MMSMRSNSVRLSAGVGPSNEFKSAHRWCPTVGAALLALSAWGFGTQERSWSVVQSCLIALTFGGLCCAAGITLARRLSVGLALARLVSVVSVLYSLAWLTLGGVDDAGEYAAPLLGLVALSVSSLLISRSSYLPNKTMEPTR